MRRRWAIIPATVLGDELDRALLEALQEDGTLSCRALALRCKSSEPTVRRRLRRLRQRDVFRIAAVVDPFKQGYPVVAIINMKVDQREMRAVKSALSEMRELGFVGVTVGAFDMVAEAWFRYEADEMCGSPARCSRRFPAFSASSRSRSTKWSPTSLRLGKAGAVRRLDPGAGAGALESGWALVWAGGRWRPGQCRRE